jgi:quercetin dioxygenase-like cupin family protein
MRRQHLLNLAAAGLLAAAVLTACGDLPQTDPNAKATREDLLDKARKTVLDQDLEYPHDTHAEVSSGIVTIPPGVETGWHRHDTPLVVHVMEGVVTVEYDGGVVKEYGPGDTFVEAIGTKHNGRNLGDVDVVIYTVSIGAEGLQNTVNL